MTFKEYLQGNSINEIFGFGKPKFEIVENLFGKLYKIKAIKDGKNRYGLISHNKNNDIKKANILLDPKYKSVSNSVSNSPRNAFVVESENNEQDLYIYDERKNDLKLISAGNKSIGWYRESDGDDLITLAYCKKLNGNEKKYTIDGKEYKKNIRRT
jgi:hypothetical protein